MKKLISLILFLSTILLCSACGSNTSSTDEAGDMSTQIANPFVECSSMEEAANIAGFALNAPDMLEGYSGKLIQVVPGEMLQIFYTDTNEEEDIYREVMVRKAPGTEGIRGDYGDYVEETVEEVDGRMVTLRGTEGWGISNASWTSEDYSYYVSANIGIPKEDFIALISQIS